MRIESLLTFLHKAEKLKCNTRHSWTSDGRQESVAEHSWRLTLMAYLISDEFPDLNRERVMLMCLCHDLGEAVTGDIPAFWKQKQDDEIEEKAVRKLLEELPLDFRQELTELFEDMWTLKTPEAQLTKALDKIETLISHGEASLNTWLPLEYEANLVYGREEAAVFSYTERLWNIIQGELHQKVEGKTT